ncbi:hypothetical protein ABIG06_004625 [Bradyrhizobium sp. USDA 326]|uniref:hypothetical protein n=1 Tax=unclassified Bradyrhizobium TaxID=2631580 RepID=UPI003515CC93
MSAVSFALSRAHSRNIERYHRLLKTHLTDVERNYIEWRLLHEQAALAAIEPSHADAGRAVSVY